MNVLSLFSGAGGSCLGAHRLGLEHLACVELDASAGATLGAAGFPWLSLDLSDPDERARLDRYRGQVDILEASPPCQCWSAAGNRLGARDTARNGWPWTWDVCDRVQPTWLVAENVSGLLPHRGDCPTRIGGDGEPLDCPGCYWSQVILSEARKRFSWVGAWRLNAADYGVPQHRRRVFLVCGPRPVRPPAPTHGDPATLGQVGLFTGTRRPWRTMGEALLLGPAAHDVGGGRNAYLTRPAPSVTAQEVKGTRSATGDWSGGADRASDVLAVSTGRRRIAIGEAARLQGFPCLVNLHDPSPLGPNVWTLWPFRGTKEARYRQVGNAVPPALARAVLGAVRQGADI